MDKKRQLQPAKEKVNLFRKLKRLRKKGPNLNNPMEPILSIRLARIIEELPEALTWALVSQKCPKKIGSLKSKILEKQKNKKKLPILKKPRLKLKNPEKFKSRELKNIKGIEPTMFNRNIKIQEKILSESLE